MLHENSISKLMKTSMGYKRDHGISMEHHGIPMKDDGISCTPRKFHMKIPQKFPMKISMGYLPWAHRITMKHRGIPMKYYGIPCTSWTFHM